MSGADTISAGAGHGTGARHGPAGRSRWLRCARRTPRPRPGRVRPAAGLACVAVLLLGVGCASLDERRSGARAAALAFQHALRDRNGAALCAVLAPQTREEVVRTAKIRCRDAVLEEDLPRAGGVREVDVHGRQARVVLTGDTLFLSHIAARWKVVAAGCTPRPGRPYECAVQGG
ncbi:hypothetical protein [Streptomyces pactum]|uniref:hypothetical protein n=1 Tax=Streptomyces pactum TaxID=68249 RepID=UPI00370034ED